MRRKFLTGLILCAGAVAGVAVAHHDLGFTFSVTPDTAGSVASSKAYSSAGTFTPASGTTHLPPGTQVAYANDTTSPVTPPPQNGDQVGEGTSFGDLWQDGCGNPKTNTFTVTWVEPIGTGAPTGTVAELSLRATPLPGLTISKRAFVVYKSNGDAAHAAAHYDLVVPDMPDEYACSGSSSWSEVITYAYAKSNGVTTNRAVAKNPATPGTYTAKIEYKDTSGATHSDSASVTIK